MELHTAIKFIVDKQGTGYLHNNSLCEALSCKNAFQKNIALQGILKVIIRDGYLDKILKCRVWGETSQTILSEFLKIYPMDESFVEYVIRSIAYGIGILQKEPNLFDIKQRQEPLLLVAPKKEEYSHSPKEWQDTSINEREKFLNSLVEIQESKCGININNVYVSDTSYDNDLHLKVNFEIAGQLKIRGGGLVNPCIAFYDTKGRIRECTVLTSSIRMPHKATIRQSRNFVLKMAYKELAKILFYLEEE